MEKIEFEFAGMELLEPMSLVTNWIISITCVVIFTKLYKKKTEFEHYWTLFFLVFSLSTFSGALSHIFYNYTGLYGKLPPFSLAIIANYFIDRASFTKIQNQKKREFWEWFALAKAIICVILLSISVNFMIVQVNTAITAAIILVWFSISTKDQSDAWKQFLTGIGFLVITASVQIAKLNIHLWFNKDDFSHILIAIAMVFFYRGIVLHSKSMKTEVD
jgi:hypothetical protein